MDNSIIEKKFKKIGSKELRVKLSRGLLSVTEVEIVKGILIKREGESYKSPDFEKESQETVKKIAEKQKDEPDSTTTKESKPKAEKKTLKVVLTPEVSAKIKKVVDEFKGSKKELVVYLLENGFTKQQLDKYRPEIAHWSYVYDVARSMGK